ncbi:MAG: YitT family protein [Thermoplasmatota archaeon]
MVRENEAIRRSEARPHIIRRVVKDYALITLGIIIMALGMIWFLDPYKVSAGGISGISIVLRRVIGVPLGLTMLVLNIPLFVLGIKLLGKRFGIRTLYGFVLFSVAVDLLDRVLYGIVLDTHPYLLSDPSGVNVLKDLDPLLAGIFGGVMIGLGLGLVFRAQGSTGGSDIIAQIAVKYRIMTAGQAFLLFDFLVIATASIFFGNVGYALIGFVALFISSKTVDVLVEGMGNTKGLYIISYRWEDVNRRILKEINRGVTILHGKGGYSMRDREVLFCVVTRRSIYHVRQIVVEEDPDAFMVIADLHEVYGLGFKPQKEEETPV